MPFTVGKMFGTTNEGRGTIGTINVPRAKAVACSCPACTGLQCLERPRFFAGQLLSEAELNSEMDYMLAKQRLHNRYLHGVGTVCGLEVVCSNCDGQVIVKPGYAIDPCGNDVIVCQEQQFDVMKAIQACCDAIKKKNKTVCDPYRPFNQGCTGLEQKWCITIAYQETQTQPVTPLRGKTKTCSCAGSCSSVGSCGCPSCNGSTTQSNGCTPPATAPTTPTSISCEPTRVLESFTLGVVPDPESCSNLQDMLQDSLLFKLGECVSLLFPANLQKNFSQQIWQVLVAAFSQQLATSQTSNADAFSACCQFRQFVIDLFTNGDFATRCTALQLFDSIPCPPLPSSQAGAGGGGSDPAYLQQVQGIIDLTLLALVEYIRECVCHVILPSCPPDPGDNRLILACVTINDGKITDICNFGCRQFAGSFPSFFYWLSLIPIIPLLKFVVDEICCGATRDGVIKPPQLNQRETAPMSSFNRIDTAGILQRSILEGNSALPRMLLERMGDAIQKFSVEGLISGIPANSLNLATLRGMSSKDAQASLAQFGVSFEEQQVNSRAEIPLLPQTPTALGDILMPFATSGDHVVLYEMQGTVAEVQRAGKTQAATTDVAALRKQVESLQADIADLKKQVTKKK